MTEYFDDELGIDEWLLCEHPERPATDDDINRFRMHVHMNYCRPCLVALQALHAIKDDLVVRWGDGSIGIPEYITLQHALFAGAQEQQDNDFFEVTL